MSASLDANIARHLHRGAMTQTRTLQPAQLVPYAEGASDGPTLVFVQGWRRDALDLAWRSPACVRL